MANFQAKTFIKYDDYMTPKYVWEDIKELIPKEKVIWEAFYGDGESGKYLQELGFDVIHKPIDFYDNDLGDIIISNPPFSQTKTIVKRLRQLEKPFIIILPVSKITTSYFRQHFIGSDLQIIIPKKRINFIKLVEGKQIANKKSACNFDCFYYCYKMNLPNSITWM